jgi:hypothetical protein
MIVWAIIVLVLSFFGFILNIMAGININLLLHDAVLALIACGILVRIRFQSEGDKKENLLKENSNLKEQKDILFYEKELLEREIKKLKSNSLNQNDLMTKAIRDLVKRYEKKI